MKLVRIVVKSRGTPKKATRPPAGKACELDKFLSQVTDGTTLEALPFDQRECVNVVLYMGVVSDDPPADAAKYTQ